MSYDENRISDLIDGGLHEQKQLHISSVSGSIKELNHYCRRRDCVFHNGISKRENVMCSHKKPEVVSGQSEQFKCHSCGTNHSGKNDDQLFEICHACFDGI